MIPKRVKFAKLSSSPTFAPNPSVIRTFNSVYPSLDYNKYNAINILYFNWLKQMSVMDLERSKNSLPTISLRYVLNATRANQ